MQRRKKRRRRPSIPSIIALLGVIALVVGIFTILPFGFFADVGKTAGDAIADGMATTTAPVETGAPQATLAAAAQTEEAPQTTLPPAKTGIETIRIATVGDIMNHDGVFEGAKLKTEDGEEDAYDFTPYFSMIKSYLSDADLTFANFEAPVRPDRKVHGYAAFNAPYEYLEAVKDAGIDYISLANNHILDTYVDGAIATMGNVKKAGLVYAGTALSQEEFDTTVMIEYGDIKIAFLSFTTSTNGMEEDCDQEKLPYTVKMFDEDTIIADIKKAKADGADVVLLSLHWGKEYSSEPSSTQKKQAQAFCEAGADVIMGSHPHVLQPLERFTVEREDGPREALVIYSMGNFISDQRKAPRDTGAIFYFSIAIDHDNGGAISITETEYLPTWVWKYEDDSGKNTFRIVPAGKYAEDRLDNMESRVKKAWEEATELIGSEIAIALRG